MYFEWSIILPLRQNTFNHVLLNYTIENLFSILKVLVSDLSVDLVTFVG